MNCKHCQQPIEKRKTPHGFVWIHSDSKVAMCSWNDPENHMIAVPQEGTA